MTKDICRQHAVKCVENDLGGAHDNFHRATIAARHCDPTQQWGQSGQTLNEIIADYQQAIDRAAATLAWLRTT